MADTVKVTVTLPTEQLTELKNRVRKGEIESVSGYVTQTVGDRLAREEWLRRWRARHGTPTAEDAARADEFIDQFWGTGQERRAS